MYTKFKMSFWKHELTTREKDGSKGKKKDEMGA